VKQLIKKERICELGSSVVFWGSGFVNVLLRYTKPQRIPDTGELDSCPLGYI